LPVSGFAKVSNREAQFGQSGNSLWKKAEAEGDWIKNQVGFPLVFAYLIRAWVH
jgi:hypothetical protein